MGDEGGVCGLELAHIGAALGQGHTPFPCYDAVIATAREDLAH